MRDLHAHWAVNVVPKDAPPVQRQEMERAFFSGAFALFILVLADVAALPDDQSERAMNDLHEEMQDYFRLLATIPGPSGTSRQ